MREPDHSQFEVQVSNSTSLNIDNNTIDIHANETWRYIIPSKVYCNHHLTFTTLEPCLTDSHAQEWFDCKEYVH